MKQTAVQSFWDKIALKLSVEQVNEFLPEFENTKEMEKEQILTTWSVATNPDYEIGFGDMFYILEQEKKAEQYYNETFNIKEK
jgi:hypothetical protein